MGNNLHVTGNLLIDGTTDLAGGVLNTDLVTNFNADLLDSAHKSIDGTLAANSDVLVPSQKAVKTYADTALALKANDNAVVKLTGNQEVAGDKTFSGTVLMAPPFYHVRDQKASGTDGGSAVAGAWTKRTLDTEIVAGIAGASLATSQITLPAGTYDIRAVSAFYNTGKTKLRLRTTGAVTLLTGLNVYLGLDAVSTELEGRITLAATTVLELQYWASYAQGGQGLGGNVTSGEVEVYSEVWIWRLQ